MASISEERLREMEEEMDRFEAEIQIPGGPPSLPFILRASTFDKVQAQLTSLRQESSRLQQKKESKVEDVDLRQLTASFTPGPKRKYSSDEDENEFHDIDERPGRPQGPLVPPPPPPPLPLIRQPAAVTDGNSLFVPLPPPPPPPEPDSGDVHSTLSFKPYGPGEGPQLSRPAFLPPQLRHRAPPPGLRPPFMRPMMQMGGPPMPFGGPMGFPRHPHMMGPGQMNAANHPGLPVAGVGVSVPPGPQPGPPGVEPGAMQFMTSSLDAPNTDASSAVTEQSKVVYAAAPVITVERKKEEKKKKKKKKKGQAEAGNSGENQDKTAPAQNSKDTNTTVASLADEDKSVLDMEIVPDSALVGGIMVANAAQDAAALAAAAGGNMNAQGIAGSTSKKEKKKKEKKFLRLAANTTWEDPTLSEWQQDDFRMFCGDLGNEVTDETLVRAFNKYPSFLKAKVIRDRRTNKTKGYGFVSFKDPVDFARAMREMNGKYVGNRPIKLRKSSWRDRNLEVVRKKEKEKKKLGLK